MKFETDITVNVVQAVLVFTRISAFLYAGPVFSMSQFNVKWKTFFALCITLLVVPVLPDTWGLKSFKELDIIALTLIVTSEVIFGLSVALIVRMLMEVAILGGYIIGRDMGFAMARMFDPAVGSQTTVVSMIFGQMFAIMFLVTNSHHDFIRLAVLSFETIGPGKFYITQSLVDNVLELSSRVFVDGFRLALPIFTCVMTINVAMGLITKFAQDFQVMMLSFPIRLGLGIFVLMSMIPVVVVVIRDLIDRMLGHIHWMLVT